MAYPQLLHQLFPLQLYLPLVSIVGWALFSVFKLQRLVLEGFSSIVGNLEAVKRQKTTPPLRPFSLNLYLSHFC